MTHYDLLLKNAVWANVSGWGSTGNGQTSEILWRAEIRILKISSCRDVFDRETLTPDMICAGVEGGHKDACNGDSGGPLTCHDATSGEKYLCGIVSFGSPCENNHESPGVCTDVRKYHDWIQNHITAQSK